MGSFNVACSVSNISMGVGDDIVYIPLQVSRYPYGIGDGNNMLIYPWCFYSPATLPIFGIYDDYGGIESIERNRNVEIIEEHFGCKIEDVCEIGCKIKPISSGMFIKRGIYDTLVSMNRDEWGKKSKSPGFFRKIDFQKDLTEWVETVKKEKDRRFDNAKCKALRSMFEDSDVSMKAHIIKSRKKPWWAAAIGGRGSVFTFQEYRKFNDVVQPALMNGDLHNEVIEFIKFEHGLSATNNFYFPAMNGYQCGHKYASGKLYWEAYKLMVKEIFIEKWRKHFDRFSWWSIKYEIKRMVKKIRRKK